VTAQELLQRLRSAGAVVTADGEKLLVDGPERLFTPRAVELIRAHKPELLLLLRKPSKPDRAEVERRAALLVPRIPRDGHVPVLPIVSPAPSARWGACIMCGDPLEPHVGGQCATCTEALWLALQRAGRVPT
jgi:hypothetical protein